MNDCRRHQTLRIETEIDGAPPPPAHCPECEAFAGVVIRIVGAGRALGRIEPPAERVEAGRRRLLDLLASGGGRGLTVFLAFAGGVLLAGFALSGAAERRLTAPEAVVTAAVGTAGAAAAMAGEPGARRPAHPSSRGPARALAGGSALPTATRRAIMPGCDRSPAYS